MAQKQDDMAQKQEDMTVVIPLRFQASVKGATVEILSCDQNTYVGVGFFVRPDLIITAAHNLSEVYAVGATVFVNVHADNGNLKMIEFTYRGDLVGSDISVISSSSYTSPHVLQISSVAMVPDSCTRLAVTTFHNAISQQLGGSIPRGFGVFPAILLRRSEHHLLYDSTLFSGDSGAALIHAGDGTVIGLHQEAVNEAGDTLKEEEFKDTAKVGHSVNSLLGGLSQGFVGLRLDTAEVRDFLAKF